MMTTEVEQLSANIQTAAARARLRALIVNLLLLAGGASWIYFSVSKVRRADEQHQILQAKVAEKEHKLDKAEKDLRRVATETQEQSKSLDELRLLIEEERETLHRIEELIESGAAGAQAKRVVLPQFAKNGAYDLWKKGYAAYNQKNLKEAKSYYERAIAADPRYAPPYTSLGRLSADEKDYLTAETWTRKSLSLRPDYAPALNNMGWYALMRGDASMAAQWCARALKARPGFENSLNLKRRLEDEGYRCSE